MFAAKSSSAMALILLLAFYKDFTLAACPQGPCPSDGTQQWCAYGKPVIILVADRMCSGRNCRDFGNFHNEWKLQLSEKRITASQFDVRMRLLDSTRELTPKPAEYEAKLDDWAMPPKIHITGREGEEIGIAFSGEMRTAMEFGSELKRKRNHPFGDNRPRTIHAVAQIAEHAHRNTIKANFGGVDQGEIIHYAADAQNIYGVKIGRTQILNERGDKVPEDPYVVTSRGHLYSQGVNEVALRYLEPRFGPANLPFPQPPPMKTYRLEEAKQHVIEAMRLNARDDASRGTFSVSENFDAYIFTPGEKAVHWEHDPPLDPRTKARLEHEVPPIETMKKLIRQGLLSDDITGRFQLTEQQKVWRDIAMRDLEHEREMEVRSRRGNSPESTYIWSTGTGSGGTMRERRPLPRRTGRGSMQSPNRRRSNPHNKNRFNKHANRRQMRAKKILGLNSPRIIKKRARG